MNVKKLAIFNKLKQLALIVVISVIGANLVGANTEEISYPDEPYSGTYSGYFLAANLAISKRDYAKADDFLMHLLADAPDDLLVTESLFLVNHISGDFTKARLFASKFHRDIIDQDLPESAHHYLSKLFLSADFAKRGDYKKALANVEKGDDFMISEMSFSLLSTWLNYADDNPLAAVDNLNLLKENSFHRIYYLINSAFLAELQERNEDADGFYNEALSIGGTKLDLVNAYGRFLEHTDSSEKALALYDDFENRAGSHELIDAAKQRIANGDIPEPMIANGNQAIAYSFYHIANIYYSAGNYDEAINFARLGQYLVPDNDFILNILSLSYQNIAKNIEANEILQKITEQSPFYVQAQLRMAANLEINGQKGLALEKVAVLQNVEKPKEIVTLEYAKMLSRSKNYEQSVKLYDRLIESRELLTVNDADLFFSRGVGHERLKNWQQAEVDFIQALKLNPGHYNALNYLGYTWVDKGINLDEGLEMINNALLVSPQNVFIIDSLGWAYYKLGRYEEARKELERALMVSPGNADISDHLGDVYWQLDRKLEAEFKWAAATIFKSDEINYDDLEYKRKNGLDALLAKKQKAK